MILGQDPYHNFNQAHGLCFSVRPPTPAPPSLKNIYTALKNDYPTFRPPPKNGGLLTPWADNGVLLLNTCLTVRAHQANSHANKGWEKFTQKVIDIVNERRTKGVVFLAWGSPAQKRTTKVNKKRHLVLTSVHPSPLSAYKGFVSILRHYFPVLPKDVACTNASRAVGLRPLQKDKRVAERKIWRGRWNQLGSERCPRRRRSVRT